jgi:hypothetical protein
MTAQIDEDLAPPWVLDGPRHSLSRLSAEEIRTARVIMTEACLVGLTTRFLIFVYLRNQEIRRNRRLVILFFVTVGKL